MLRMKRTILSCVFAATAVMTSVRVVAQTREVMLTFDQALLMTMDNNPQMAAQKFEERAADLQRMSAVGLRFPRIDVNAAYAHLGKDIDVDIDLNGIKPGVKDFALGLIGELGQHGITLPPELINGALGLFNTDWGGMSLGLQKKDVFTAGATLTVPLYMGGKINAANRAAQLNLKTVVKQGEQAANALVSELAERYFGLVLAEQVVKVRQQVVDGVAVHLHDAIALEEQGIIARGERLYAEYKLAEAQRELLAARLEVQTIRSALAATLNTPLDCIPVSGMFVTEDLPAAQYFKDLAVLNSPLLQQVDLKRQLAEQNVKVQRAQFLPQIAALGAASFYDYQLSDMLPRWAVGATLSLNIFDGTSREHKYSAAKNTVRQVEALQVKAGNDIGVLVEKIYNRMKSYHDQMPSIEASIRFADEYLRIKNAAFREGMASSADVIDAQLNLAKVKTERMQAAYNFDLSLARLLEASGISGEFPDYLRSVRSRQIRFE